MCVCVLGITSSLSSADRSRDRPATDAIGTQSLARYAGAQPWRHFHIFWLTKFFCFTVRLLILSSTKTQSGSRARKYSLYVRSLNYQCVRQSTVPKRLRSDCVHATTSSYDGESCATARRSVVMYRASISIRVGNARRLARLLPCLPPINQVASAPGRHRRLVMAGSSVNSPWCRGSDRRTSVRPSVVCLSSFRSPLLAAPRRRSMH